MKLVITKDKLCQYKESISLFSHWFGFDIVHEISEAQQFLQANWELNIKYFDGKCNRIMHYALNLRHFILFHCNPEKSKRPIDRLLEFAKEPNLKLVGILEFAPKSRRKLLEQQLKNLEFQYDALLKKRDEISKDIDIDDISNENLLKWVGFSLDMEYDELEIKES